MEISNCDRIGCNNQNCDTWIDTVDMTVSICKNCQDEFIQWFIFYNKDLNLISNDILTEQLGKFLMKELKNKNNDNFIREKITQFFNSHKLH